MSKSRLIDVPIERGEDESLGVYMYAEILARFIMSCETPITIGIQGDWGIGKTSMLNMVRELLEPKKGRKSKYHIIYFNTWQYSQFNQEQFLSISILKGIMEEVKNLESFKESRKDEKVKNAIKDFGSFIAKLGNQVIKEHTGVDIKGTLEDENSIKILDDDLVIKIRQMKEKFSDLVKILVPNETDRLIIMIDDLDRIKPVRALEFLEAIKNFLDVESCIFMMAVDYSVIQSGMVEKLGRTAQELQGKSYFDKIIQVPFTMPSSSYMTDKYIMSLLGWNFSIKEKEYNQIEGEQRDQYFLKVRAKNISKEDIEFFTNITELTVGKNPRSIKRAVNYANLLRMVVQSQRSQKRIEGSRNEWTIWDAKILYPLSCMQLAWPELFIYFSNEPNISTLAQLQDFDFIEKLKGIKSIFKRVYNPEETMSNITGFIDEYIALIDQDGDGKISIEEFKPIRKMMDEANLTAAKIRSMEDDLKKLEKMIIKNMGEKKDNNLAKKVIGLFRDEKSLWNNRKNFNLLSAGKKFFNITWCKKQVGSFVSTQREPAQIYLKGSWDKYNDSVLAEAKPYMSDVQNIGHYGTGDILVKIEEIAKRKDGIGLMNSIFKEMQNQLFQLLN